MKFYPSLGPREDEFLSCLFGSEERVSAILVFVIFLSCLFGSEGRAEAELAGGVFLSCLFGSEA